MKRNLQFFYSSSVKKLQIEMPKSNSLILDAQSAGMFSVHFIHDYFKLLINYINRYFHEVLCALVKLHFIVVQLPDASTFSSDHIMDNPKFAPYFSSCMGAFDSTYVDMYVLAIDQPHYQNKKQGLSQNVLAVCNFEIEFTYILPG